MSGYMKAGQYILIIFVAESMQLETRELIINM